MSLSLISISRRISIIFDPMVRWEIAFVLYILLNFATSINHANMMNNSTFDPSQPPDHDGRSDVAKKEQTVLLDKKIDAAALKIAETNLHMEGELGDIVAETGIFGLNETMTKKAINRKVQREVPKARHKLKTRGCPSLGNIKSTPEAYQYS
jgi:hypothetical protein